MSGVREVGGGLVDEAKAAQGGGGPAPAARREPCAGPGSPDTWLVNAVIMPARSDG